MIDYERPSPLGFGPAGRSVMVPELPAHTHTHTLTAMPQRYSHQRRKASTAAARRMERRRRDQGKSSSNNNPTSNHSHRSKKLAMLSRSLILCHSKTNDDCPEERHAGEVADGCRTWGPGCRADGTAGDQTRYRDTENRHWRATQQSAQEKRGGTEADNQLHHPTTLRENKRSIRRSFSIKPPDRGRREQGRHRSLVGDDNVSLCGAPSLHKTRETSVGLDELQQLFLHKHPLYIH